MYNAVICRYHEIAIKGNNRSMFEKCLVDNLRYLLSEIADLRFSRVRGRVWIEKKTQEAFASDELAIIRNQLPKAFGLETFSPVIMCACDIGELRQAVFSTVRQAAEEKVNTSKPFSFRIRAKRSDKRFPLASKDIEISLAEEVEKVFGGELLTVDLDHAQFTVGCEVRERFSFIFYDSYGGPGGLPNGSNASVLALLSGGIDSPVACYMTMKRGCPVDYITFHSSPYTPPETVDKVKRLVKLINTFQRPRKLFVCNLAPIQKMIRDNCNDKLRTVLYRRMMFRISEKVAEQNGNKALLTGEAVGQVASQTITNLNTINSVTNILVLRPLIGMDKNEAIRLSEKMGAFEISKEQVPDSCTVFAPKSPSTAAALEKVIHEESRLGDFESVLDKIVDDIEVVC